MSGLVLHLVRKGVLFLRPKKPRFLNVRAAPGNFVVTKPDTRGVGKVKSELGLLLVGIALRTVGRGSASASVPDWQ